MRYYSLKTMLVLFLFAMCVFVGPSTVMAAGAKQIDHDTASALEALYEKSPSAKIMGEKAAGILVFPSIVKGGFIVGGQYGKGALIRKGEHNGYYETVQISYGLQAGLQKYGYALFLMNESAMKYLDRSDGWELGVGPTIVVIDMGAAGSVSTTTAKADIYAFFFNQKGLMAGLGIQGTKITKLSKEQI